MNCLICNRSIDRYSHDYDECPEHCPFNEPVAVDEALDPSAGEAEATTDGLTSDTLSPAQTDISLNPVSTGEQLL